MFDGGTPYSARLEIACVMFIEPCETKDMRSCLVSHISLAKIMKAYRDMDEVFS